MDEFSDIWIEQCEAARDIREAWGPKKALGHVIGEKLLNHICAADSGPEWAEKLPLFVAEIKRIFTTDELRRYFATTTRVGAAGQSCGSTYSGVCPMPCRPPGTDRGLDRS